MAEVSMPVMTARTQVHRTSDLVMTSQMMSANFPSECFLVNIFFPKYIPVHMQVADATAQRVQRLHAQVLERPNTIVRTKWARLDPLDLEDRKCRRLVLRSRP